MADREEKKIAREEAQTARVNEERRIDAEYYKLKDSEALLNLVAKAESFIQYHTKLAKDGVGYERQATGTDPDGNAIFGEVLVHFDAERRLRELDKAVGQQELLDYLTRRLTIKPVTNPKEK
jgi:hypothetical protein